MARIKGKLNLNRVPELVENNSLVFAKNVRWFANSFRADYGFSDLGLEVGDSKIVGIIQHNTKFYVFLFNQTTQESAIKVYDEIEKTFTPVECNWHYGGVEVGETAITGYCTTDLYGETILTIGEYPVGVSNLQIPLKHIVIGEKDNNGNMISSYDDDESIYTQSPNIPLLNLKLLETYNNTIPAGTYQFFIRYEIRKNHYTNWFPASKELFTGTTRTMLTNQGKVHYVDKTVDSNKSFILRVERVREVIGFKSFQLGFIIAHDNEVYARAYKHYDLNTTDIYFDYDTDYIEEIDIKEIIENVYNLYNVKNVTSYKNKLYIANYIESDFNPDLADYAANVDIELKTSSNTNIQTFAGYHYNVNARQGVNYIESLDLDDISGDVTKTIPEIIELILAEKKTWIKQVGSGDESISRLGITATFSKYTEQDIEPYDDGDIIQPGDEPIDPAQIDRNYYITSNGGIIQNDADIQPLLDAIVNDTLGIRISDGKVMSDAWIENENYIIKYYSLTSPRHGLQYKKTTTVSIRFSTNVNDINAEYKLDSSYSLVPHQKYAFYLHFVRANGEITNGSRIPDANISGNVYEDGTVKEVIADTNASAIYPVFTFNFPIPSEYVACFVSIVHTDYNVAQIFDVQQMWSDIDREDSQKHMTGDCLELDMALYPALQDIPVIFKSTINNVTTEINTTIDYRSSYDSEFLATFGASGKCVFKKQVDGNNNPTPYVIGDEKYAFIQMPYNANEKYIQLTRCTPFITWTEDSREYDDYKSLNLLGYVCRICKPLPNYDKYFSGQDIYEVTREYKTNINSYSISLDSISDSHETWYTYKDSSFYTIYSNFNLNYVSLRETIIKNLITKEDEQQNKNTYLLLTFQSLNLSDIYELQPMYRSYTRKLYLPYTDDKNVTVFDNTIRSSELQGDEEHINMFKFRPTDYYHVPTNRGKIVNLVAVADNILVHTEDSMYRFTGTNSLMTAGGEDVAMTESQPFDTGIQEIFGSEYGYGGLQNKEHQTLTEMGYVYFDRDARRLYLYGDQNRMEVLSNDIENLFKRKPISSIRIADDYYNNRVFVCITFNDGKIATLSYNFVAKSFISLHDFAFDWTFKTKTKCYFVYNRSKIYVIDDTIGEYEDLAIQDTLYPYDNGNCIVDVIYNESFEVIKTINTLSWICNEITSVDSTINMAEETFTNAPLEKRYKGDKLAIYTDSCYSDTILLNDNSNPILVNDRSNDHPLSSVDSYKKARYNLGKWHFNYFRNILNRVDEPISPRTLTEEDTLIYGKYIVASFTFNRTTNFKFEDVTFNITTEYNV